MVVLDEKDVVVSYYTPPPPYVSSEVAAALADPAISACASCSYRTLSSLPSHLVLRIVEHMLPSQDRRQDHDRFTRTTTRLLYWIASHLRLTCRSLYLASMHILRSAYLPVYTRLVRSPYTTDPFPYTAQASNLHQVETTVLSLQRETEILDRFIVLSLREALLSDDSTLHNADTDAFSDLFSFMQPRARLEDLVCEQGAKAGVVISPQYLSSNTKSRTPMHSYAVPFSSLSVQFTPASAKLLLSSSSAVRRKQTIVEVRRARGDTLERTAKQVIRLLETWVNDRR